MTSTSPQSRRVARLLATVLPASTVGLGGAAAIARGEEYQQSSGITPPPVPTDLKVEAGNRLFLVGRQEFVPYTADYFFHQKAA